ncbi:MAG: bifunctional aspartate kinase/diaminopimelate decarboxylase [Pseudomonadota bacterium]
MSSVTRPDSPSTDRGQDGARRWVVLKFGGSSVATTDNWRNILALLHKRREAGFSVFVVHSALRGVSDLLQSALCAAAHGEPDDVLVDDIIARHEALAKDLGLVADEVAGEYVDELRQLLAGIRLVREVTPRLSARVMALGELMSTSLSVAWLSSQSLDVKWWDARQLLTTEYESDTPERRRYLSATCDAEPDPELLASLDTEQVHVTQGFIAGNAEGETVLLGRGGSDTSAAYLAAMLSADGLEIWTDVPGMFSADPKVVTSARLLKRLHYDEAQEIASTGGLVLHPRCLGPLRRFGVPLSVRCTPRPELPGTIIGDLTQDPEPSVKAISLRQNVTLISMEGVVMWQEVGFLARVFDLFARHSVSIDLVSTSESNVTVSIDQNGDPLSDDDLAALVSALSDHCRVNVIRNCAAVSLVGRKIRAHLHKLGPSLSVFEEHRVHLLSQAANDLNLTVVVDESQGYRLVQQLHHAIIGKRANDDTFGDSWEAIQNPVDLKPATTVWWRRKAAQLLDVLGDRQACYVYDSETVQQRIDALKSLSNIDNVLFAMKANSNVEIMQQVHAAGIGFECVSPGELDRVFGLFPDLDPKRVLYTPNFAPAEDYLAGFKRGVNVTLDNLFPLRQWPDVFKGRDIFVRLDPGKGRGHHEHVRTAGVHSKFGVPLFELASLQTLTEQLGCRVCGVHAHSGSGITDADSWRKVAEILAQAAERFPDVRVLDLGGGLGVPEKPGDATLDLDAFDASLTALRQQYPDKALWLEPGRFLVAEAGVLLARVTQTKGKGQVQYVGLATGMNSLIRPALYGAYHEIANLSRLDEIADQTMTVVGPICETGDTLGNDRLLPAATAGDVMLIGNAGAYGYVMASHYNLRDPAGELVLPTSAGTTEDAGR